MKTSAVLASMACSLAFGVVSFGVAHAAPPAQCHTIRLAFVGGPDNAVQNGVFTTIAETLGYKVSTNFFSEEILYAGLKNRQLDVFLDDWKPSMDSTTAPYVKEKAISVIGPDLTGAKYTLAVPAYLYQQGLHDFSDIHKFAKQLDHKIYGIEPGTSANRKLLGMIKDNSFDLGDFHLVQSSETGMFSALARAYAQKRDIVFLGWEPAPMNVQYHIRYLSGGDKYFGSDKGSSTVYINTRFNYASECPNMGRFLRQFALGVDAENHMMYDISVNHAQAPGVAAAWLKKNPGWIAATLKGVTTVDGKPAAPVVLHKLGA
ncbi:MAG TPA: glycine betaine ABC transporter substrate-binding protein [Acidiphilium sp.]